MKFHIVTTILLASLGCAAQQNVQKTFENPYDEINSYFEVMGLTRKREKQSSLVTSREKIIIGLGKIYDKWGLDIDTNSPLTDEMIVCSPDSRNPEQPCITWVWQK